MFGRLDAEKLERFYLSSCVDTSVTGNSTHQSFPLVEEENSDDENEESMDENNNKPSHNRNDRGRVQESRIPRPRGRSSSITAKRSRVQIAFHKLYDSLMCLAGQKSVSTSTRDHYVNTKKMSQVKMTSSGDVHKGPLSPSMSKEQFLEQLHRLVEDIERKSASALPGTNKKSPFTTATPSRTQNNHDDNHERPPASQSLSAKLAIFGFFLIIMFGFAKMSKSI